MTPAADLQLVNSEICTQHVVQAHTQRIEYPLVYTAPHTSCDKKEKKKTHTFEIGSFMLA